MSKRKKLWVVLGVILIILVIIRMMLPHIIVSYLNKTLDEIPEYNGHVTDVDLSLIRGAYAIDSLYIFHEDSISDLPFFAATRIDLSVQWKELLSGSLVGEIELQEPQLNFLVYQSGDTTGIQSGSEADWTKPLKELLPIRINELRGVHGKISYIDPLSDPKVNIYLNNLNFYATNISNVKKVSELPSVIRATATSIGGGRMRLDSRMDLLREIPEMDMEFSFEDADLTAFNDFTSAYAKLDAEKGTLNVYSEAAIADDVLEGYIKPVLTDVKIVDFSEDKKKPLKLIWESVAGFVMEIFENQKHDQFATKIQFHGDLKNVDSPIWPTIGGIFKNAFIKAFTKSTENEVNFDEVVSKEKK